MTTLSREQEEWRDIAGYEGLYEVSSLGRVRSHQTIGKRGPDGCLKPRLSHGYPAVNLRKNNQAKAFSVHRLVLEAFVGLRPPGMECTHLNGQKPDARLTNLQWRTKLENEHDKILHGTKPVGERCHTAKITDQQKAEIAQSNLATRLLAEQYGLSYARIQKIRSRARQKGTTECHAQIVTN